MKKNEKYAIVGIVIVVVLIVICICIYAFSHKDADGDGVVESNGITTEEVESLYEILMQDCEGAITWDLSAGDAILVTDDMLHNACQNDNYYSKLFGFTDSETGAIMDVTVMKKVDDKAYKLDGTLIGDFVEEEMDELLNHGTTYRYSYTFHDGIYSLEQVELSIEDPTESE